MFIFDKGNLTGIDIGSYAVKVVKIKGAGDRRLLGAVGYSKLDHLAFPQESSRLSGILRTLFSAQRIKTRKVAAVLPGSSLTLMHMYLPKMPKKDMKEAVRWEMRKQISFPPDELVCDFTTIGEVKRGEESMLSLIAFGAQNGDVERLLKTMEDASLNPVAVDVVPMAMLLSFDHNNAWEEGANYSMVDIGDSKSTLAIFKDRKLVFAREIPIGGKELTNVVMNALSCGEDVAEAEKIKYGVVRSDESASGVVDAISGVIERLAAEMHRSFDYYQAQFREGSISKIFLCGGTAKLKGIDDFLSNILGVPCFIDDPLRNIRVEPKRFDAARLKGFAPDLAVAVGLSLKADVG